MLSSKFLIILLLLVIIANISLWLILKRQEQQFIPFLTYWTPTFLNPDVPQDYYDKVKLGGQEAVNKKVVICGMVRDVESRVGHIRDKIEKVGSMFKKYRVLIVENDSQDNTRKLLLNWANENSNVKILGCGYNVSKCTLDLPKTVGHKIDIPRMKKMVKLRNIYLKEVKKHYKKYDYMIAWDLDIIGTVYLDGILNSLGHFASDRKIDVITANGVLPIHPNSTKSKFLFYDPFAHLKFNETPEVRLNKNHSLRTVLYEQYKFGDDLVRMKSSFSGFTIYSIPSILKHNAKYGSSGSSEKVILCEHIYFNFHFKYVYLNPSMLHIVLKNN